MRRLFVLSHTSDDLFVICYLEDVFPDLDIQANLYEDYLFSAKA